LPEKRTLSILSGIPLFREVDEAHLQAVVSGCQEISLGKGSFLFHKGDSCDGFYITIEGHIKVSFLSMEGKEHVVRIMGPGQAFAEAVMFINKPYPANAQAISDARVLYVSKDVVFQCLDDNPAFARRMIAGLSQRLHGLAIELESITLLSSTQRVIGYLLQHEVLQGTSADQADISLPVSKTIIASHLSLTPETLSRILHTLSAECLISVEGKTIHIHDIEKLRSFSS